MLWLLSLGSCELLFKSLRAVLLPIKLTYGRFYFPPTFENKHKDQGDASKKSFWVKHYDYVGTVLFSAGFVIFLIGLNWGGSVYPWQSGKVIGFIVGGFAILVIFVLYEIYMPLKAPFMPMHLFKNRGWVIYCTLLGIGAGVYYAFAVIFPMQAAVLYANGDLLYLGWLSCLIGCGISKFPAYNPDLRHNHDI
jgi:hypothetical protein